MIRRYVWVPVVAYVLACAIALRIAWAADELKRSAR